MKKKVLITSRLLPEGLEGFTSEFELLQPEKASFSRSELMSRLAEADALLPVFSYTIDKQIIDNGANLKIIANFGVGYNNIDVQYATQRGIVVTNTPRSVVEPTAELAFGLLIDISRRISESDREIRNNTIKWGLFENLGNLLYGKRLGILGMGNIGQSIARRACAFGMEIVYHNRTPLDKEIENRYNARYVSKTELMQTSDYLMICAPLTAQTRHCINEETLRQMKPSAFIINTARGQLIKEEDLVKALQQKIIAGAALDVYEFEPEITPALLAMDNVVLSPHKGTGSIESRNQMTKEALTNILNFFKGEPISRVN